MGKNPWSTGWGGGRHSGGVDYTRRFKSEPQQQRKPATTADFRQQIDALIARNPDAESLRLLTLLRNATTPLTADRSVIHDRFYSLSREKISPEAVRNLCLWCGMTETSLNPHANGSSGYAEAERPNPLAHYMHGKHGGNHRPAKLAPQPAPVAAPAPTPPQPLDCEQVLKCAHEVRVAILIDAAAAYLDTPLDRLRFELDRLQSSDQTQLHAIAAATTAAHTALKAARTNGTIHSAKPESPVGRAVEKLLSAVTTANAASQSARRPVGDGLHWPG